MQRIPYGDLKEIERSRAEMDAFRSELITSEDDKYEACLAEAARYCFENKLPMAGEAMTQEMADLEDSRQEESENRAFDDHIMTYECAKCSEKLTENAVAPWRTIDPKSGSDTFILYCEPCYNAMIKKIYGFDL